MSSIQLGDIGKVSMCKRVLKHETSSSGDIPFYKISTFGGRADVFITQKLYDKYRSKYSYPKRGDILISAAGTVGKTVVYDGSPAYFQDSNIVWIANDENVVLNRYLYYFYKTEPWRTTNGSTITRIYNENLRDTKLDVPNLEDQAKIADVLEKLDRKVELNNKTNAELETLARDLYNYWFVQFEFPDASGRPYKTAGGAMVYNEKLNKYMPKGWDTVSLSSKLTTRLGGTPATGNKDYWEDGDIPWLSSAEAANFPIVSSDAFITEEGLGNSAATLLPRGSVIVSIVRYIRPSILAINASINQSIVGILETEWLKNAYIYPFIQSEIPRLMAARTGAQQPHINKRLIDDTILIIPDKDTLVRYYAIAAPLYDKISKLSVETNRLLSLRNWLLPMLMGGQIEVG